MARRGSISFTVLMVLNPIMILLFQNCSYVPVKSAAIESAPQSSVTHEKSILQRGVASESETPVSCKYVKKSCAE